MDKKDRTIKDLKERNDKLVSQYYCSESRFFSAQYKAEQLEKENKKLKDKLKCARNYVITHTVDNGIRIMNPKYLLTILDLDGDNNE